MITSLMGMASYFSMNVSLFSLTNMLFTSLCLYWHANCIYVVDRAVQRGGGIGV